MGAQAEVAGPDFSAGIRLDEIPVEGTLEGRVGDSPVLLSRFDGELFAVSGTCTHYGASLAGGLIAGEEVRCPLHHACFDLRSGAALFAPAIDPLDRWLVEVKGGRVFVRRKLGESAGPARRPPAKVDRVVIVGGGAAGLACANELRKLGHAGLITMLSEDGDAPCDRPNLSKDYLAGTAPEEWLPLRFADWYEQNRIDLRVGTQVQRIDVVNRRVHTRSREEFAFDRLLIATGSEPNRLRGRGFDSNHVFTLRSMADAAAIAAQAKPGARAAIVGSSFIGMEAAAALRKRGVAVTVVSAEHVPFDRVFGVEIGSWLQRLHERNGVRFRLGTAAACFEGQALTLASGDRVDADFVLVGIGVRPRTDIAEAAGIAGEGCVPVDGFLETCHSGVFAAGDIAQYPDPLSGEPMRIEHWVTAERQGQVAAANMLGYERRFAAVPFFWTEQFGVALRYVGHGVRWDEVQVEGDIEGADFIARYYDQGAHCASAAVGRDLAILEDERRFERRIADALSKHREPRTRSGIECATVKVEAGRGS